MNKHFAVAALGALGLLIGCGGGGTTSTSGGGGSTSAATGTGGGGSTATGTGGSSTAASTGTGGSTPVQVCSTCVSMKDVYKDGSACATSLADCNANVDCDSWFKCVQNCQVSNFTAACFGACDQSASAVKNLYQPIYACSCGACKTECEAACP